MMKAFIDKALPLVFATVMATAVVIAMLLMTSEIRKGNKLVDEQNKLLEKAITTFEQVNK